MWTRVDTKAKVAKFRALLMECADYAPVIDKVMTNLRRPDVVVWYWEGPSFRLALAYQIRKSDAFIMVGVPSPEGDPVDWCKVMIRKLRTELDALGITEWCARQNTSYQSEHMAEFADHIDRICQEFQSERITTDNRRVVTFSRSAIDKSKDSLFEGPGKNRPPRKRT